MTDFIKNAELYDGSKEIEIFKSNALVEGAFDLSPAEHDLMTLAINKLHSQKTGGKQVFISAKEFAIANKISDKYAYEVLAETAKKLYKRSFRAKIYEDGLKKLAGEEDIYSILRPKGKHRPMDLHSKWVQAVVYEKESGFIYLMFSDVLAYLIQKTGEAYTKYSYAKTIDLQGFHTKRLYELINKWKGAKPTNGNKHPKIIMTVDEWKDFFGCGEKYDKTAEFKRWVLLPSIKKINKQKEFTLTLEQQKVGRFITHFSISVKDNQKQKKKDPKNENRDPDTIDWVSGSTDSELKITRPLTKKQADGFAGLIAKYCAKDGNRTPEEISLGATLPQAFSNWFEAIEHIKSELQKEEAYKKYIPILSKIGYKETKK